MNVKRVMRAYGVRCRAISVAICGLYSGFSLSLAQANHTFDLGYLRSMLLLLVGFCLFCFVFFTFTCPYGSCSQTCETPSYQNPKSILMSLYEQASIVACLLTLMLCVLLLFYSPLRSSFPNVITPTDVSIALHFTRT